MRDFGINRKTIIMLLLILQLVLVARSWSMSPNFGQIPDYCHAMSSEFFLLKGQTSNYTPVAENRRVDILCIGEDLVINDPIYSNGGDIIIFAGSVQLNAALDSRIYYRPSGIESYLPGNAASSTTSVRDALKFDKTQMQSFDAYYMYCIDCRKNAKFDLEIDKEIKKIEDLLMPELPHGLTPDYVNHAQGQGRLQEFMKPGLPPPDDLMDFENIRSGNIYIIASSVKVKDELKTPQIPSEIPVCSAGAPSPPINFVPYTINSGGVRGGRGGAGTPSNCTAHDPQCNHPFCSCTNANYETSGVTGPGGKGGDAGTVLIGIVAPQGPTDELRTIVSGIANVKGGTPGPSVKWLGPASSGPFKATGNACDFYRRPQGDWPNAASGKDETIVFKGFTQSEALSYLAALLGPKDASLDYDLKELAGRAYLNPSIRNASFDGYLISKIYESLAHAQVKVVIDINQVFQGLKEKDTLYVRPPFWNIKLATFENSMLSKKSLILLRELDTYDQKADGESPLIHYLTSSGGLLNLANAKPFDRFLAEATRTDISRLQIPLNQIVLNLNKLQELAVKIHMGIQTRDMQDTISRLATLLQEAETRAKSEGKPWLQSLVVSLGEAGKAIGVVYGMYYTGNWEGLAGSLPAAWDKMGKLRDVYVDRYEKISSEVPDLRAALEKAETSYRLFVKESADIRQTILEERYSAFLELLNDRSAHYSKLQNRLSQFHDLLRLSAIGFLLDPSKNREVFENNLQSIVTFVEEFPMSEPYFRFRDATNSCPRDPGLFDRWSNSDECIYTKPSKEWSTIWSPLGFDKEKQIRVPLYVVAPSITNHFLPSYGLEYSLEEIAPPSQGETFSTFSFKP